MEHVAARKLIQTEMGYAVDGNVHLFQFAYQHLADSVAVLVPNVTKNTEEHIFIGVPVHLPLVEDSDGGKVIHELGDHLNLLCDDLLSIIVANSSDDQHHLIIQIAIRVVKNFFIARS